MHARQPWLGIMHGNLGQNFNRRKENSSKYAFANIAPATLGSGSRSAIKMLKKYPQNANLTALSCQKDNQLLMQTVMYTNLCTARESAKIELHLHYDLVGWSLKCFSSTR